MSIFRSGVRKAVYLVCTKALRENNSSFMPGEKYELVLDMGSLYVIKTPQGQEVIVPKEAFAPAPDEGAAQS